MHKVKNQKKKIKKKKSKRSKEKRENKKNMCHFDLSVDFALNRTT